MRHKVILAKILFAVSLLLITSCSKNIIRNYSGPELPENEIARLNVDSSTVVTSVDETDIAYDSSKIDEIHMPPGDHKITISYVTPEPVKPYENLDPSAQAEGNNISRKINVAAAKNYYVNVTYFDIAAADVPPTASGRDALAIGALGVLVVHVFPSISMFVEFST